MKHPAVLLVTVMAGALSIFALSHFLLQNKIREERALAAQKEQVAALGYIEHDYLGSLSNLDKAVERHQTEWLLDNTRVQFIRPILKNAAVVGWLVKATSKKGYNAPIEFFMLQPIARPPIIHILNHQETPGITDFLNNPPVRVYDGVSGATITADALLLSIADIKKFMQRCLSKNFNQFICQTP